jgi:hypothetical protein
MSDNSPPGTPEVLGSVTSAVGLPPTLPQAMLAPILGRSTHQRLRRDADAAQARATVDIIGALESIIAESAVHAYELRRSGHWWARTYYLLGAPAALLAAVAGATGLASTTGRVPAAIIALAAAGLTAMATFLDSAQNQRQDRALSAAWTSLADDARLAIVAYAGERNKPAPANPTQPTSPFDMDQRYLVQIVGFNGRKSSLLRHELPSVVPPKE